MLRLGERDKASGGRARSPVVWGRVVGQEREETGVESTLGADVGRGDLEVTSLKLNRELSFLEK